MADLAFNIALGRVVELYNRVKTNDPTTSGFVLVLLKAVEADDILAGYDDLAALLTAAGNTEADFTNYSRQVITDTELAALPAPDDTGNLRVLDLPDQQITGAGGVTNNILVKAIVCYAPDISGGNSTFIPLSMQDYSVTTDGSDLIIKFHADGWYQAQR